MQSDLEVSDDGASTQAIQIMFQNSDLSVKTQGLNEFMNYLGKSDFKNQLQIFAKCTPLLQTLLKGRMDDFIKSPNQSAFIDCLKKFVNSAMFETSLQVSIVDE